MVLPLHLHLQELHVTFGQTMVLPLHLHLQGLHVTFSNTMGSIKEEKPDSEDEYGEKDSKDEAGIMEDCQQTRKKTQTRTKGCHQKAASAN